MALGEGWHAALWLKPRETKRLLKEKLDNILGKQAFQRSMPLPYVPLKNEQATKPVHTDLVRCSPNVSNGLEKMQPKIRFLLY